MLINPALDESNPDTKCSERCTDGPQKPIFQNLEAYSMDLIIEKLLKILSKNEFLKYKTRPFNILR